MSAVRLVREDDKLVVETPYHADYVSGVKALGGRWRPGSKTWSVPASKEDRLRALLLRIFGTDDTRTAPAVSAPPTRPSCGLRTGWCRRCQSHCYGDCTATQ